MSRKIMEWDHTNPIVIFNNANHKIKIQLRKLSQPELIELARKSGITSESLLNGKRGTLKRKLLALHALEFKKEWEKKYGWPIEDGRDITKLAQHRYKIKVANQQAYIAELIKAVTPFVDKEPSKELDNDLREAGFAVANAFKTTNLPTLDELKMYVVEAKATIHKKAVENNEIPAELISWQKAKSMLGPDAFIAAKEAGKGVTEDGIELSYSGKKWYLHAK